MISLYHPHFFMPENHSQNHVPQYKCYAGVAIAKLTCRYCNGSCKKYGFNKAGKQRFLCKSCKRTSLFRYNPIPHSPNLNLQIIALLKEGCSIRSIARLVSVSATTIIRRLSKIASSIEPPIITTRQSYEIDELCTYVQSKASPIWIAYAINTTTKQTITFNVGNRSNQMLSKITEVLIAKDAMVIHTDKLLQYKSLIPPAIHCTKKFGINHIERKNLTLRTHLKRLNRRTICFSKSTAMLQACLMIYFFG